MLINKKVIIIGGGPAGIATAIQLKRYNINALIIEQNQLGGLLKNAYKVENYLGFPNGVSGSELTDIFSNHIIKKNIEVLYDKVIQLLFEKDKFCIQTCKNKLESEIVVIASGTKPKSINNIYDNNIFDRIFYEVYPLRKIKNKTIGIIGAGDAAFDYAMTLSEKNKVIIFNRGENEKCLPVLFKLAEKQDNILYLKNYKLIELKKNAKKLLAVFNQNNTVQKFTFDYILFAIGREPQLDFLSDGIKPHIDSLIKNHKLFLIGDVKNGIFRQASIATANGIEAGMLISVHPQNLKLKCF